MARKGLTPVQHQREVDRLILKESRGERLTRAEYRTLHYGSAPCHCRCGVRR